ncbi:hypothetical protein V6N13_058904 [Hibiscus sabdariffa]|uniref:Uncharacterized protein n=1 Tax=Hibiscus sabdariffa TaxID=183260 RepID=A0ABR2GFS5_9ROSI
MCAGNEESMTVIERSVMGIEIVFSGDGLDCAVVQDDATARASFDVVDLSKDPFRLSISFRDMVVGTGNGVGNLEIADMTVVESEEQFGPWMQVTNRKPRRSVVAKDGAMERSGGSFIIERFSLLCDENLMGLKEDEFRVPYSAELQVKASAIYRKD